MTSNAALVFCTWRANNTLALTGWAVDSQIDTLSSNLGAGAAVAAPSTAASKLAAAVQEENDHFIRSEGDRQQLLMQ